MPAPPPSALALGLAAVRYGREQMGDPSGAGWFRSEGGYFPGSLFPRDHWQGWLPEALSSPGRGLGTWGGALRGSQPLLELQSAKLPPLRRRGLRWRQGSSQVLPGSRASPLLLPAWDSWERFPLY